MTGYVLPPTCICCSASCPRPNCVGSLAARIRRPIRSFLRRSLRPWPGYRQQPDLTGAGVSEQIFPCICPFHLPLICNRLTCTVLTDTVLHRLRGAVSVSTRVHLRQAMAQPVSYSEQLL